MKTVNVNWANFMGHMKTGIVFGYIFGVISGFECFLTVKTSSLLNAFLAKIDLLLPQTTPDITQ